MCLVRLPVREGGGVHPVFVVTLDFEISSEFGRQIFFKTLIKNPLLIIRIFFYSKAILKFHAKILKNG